MNPALPVLSVLALAGLLLRRRETGLPLAVCGLAGLLLLAAPLALPDGIPSPAASLGSEPPWQAVLDPGRGNPNLIDVSAQIYPWLLHLRHELRSGRWPFWNPYQHSGAPFWANGQSAPLFPLHLLFAAAPLQLGFLLLPWLRVVVGGIGAFLFARRLGASREGALLAGVIYPLSGMFTSYLLFPMANALALVPWVLWATEDVAAGKRRVAPLALLAGAQALAGHPETVLHTALLAALYLVVRGCAGQPLRTWGRFVAAWGLAAAVSAVHTLPLAWNLLASSRWHADAASDGDPPLAVLAALPLRLVLPELFGNPALGSWWGPYHYVGTAVYAGALALPLAAAGAAGARRDRRVLGAVVLLLFALGAAYQAPVLREALSVLPLVGRALHHRLRFAIDLGLAVLAGLGADRWRNGGGRGLIGGALLTLALLALAWWRFGADWAARGLTGLELRWTALAGFAALALLASLRLAPARRAALALVLVPFTAVELAAAHRPTNPVQRLGELYPETGAVRFLRGRPERIAGTGASLRPNAATVYRLFDARGDDSVKLLHYERLHREHLGAGHPTFFTPITRWDDPWLDRLGVRWVLAGPREAAPASGWSLAYAAEDAQVFERPQPQPLARWENEGPSGALTISERAPGRWTIRWAAEREALLVVAEAWERGWRAAVDGRRVPVERAEGHLLGVRVGPGEGRLELRHRPPGLVLGGALSVIGLASLGVLARRERILAGQ
ncbi:MAG TPA: YfhO family protein [Thermoanaerobaculia bacterium]|nr:YfhO family protein [Thermoanaerobaculia bacterium]